MIRTLTCDFPAVHCIYLHRSHRSLLSCIQLVDQTKHLSVENSRGLLGPRRGVGEAPSTCIVLAALRRPIRADHCDTCASPPLCPARWLLSAVIHCDDQLHPARFAARHAAFSYFSRLALISENVGKVRLAKWFSTMAPKVKAKIIKDVTQLVLARRTRMCNFLEYKGA